MSAEPRVLVTRPAGQADILIAQLTQAGFRTLHWPMLRVEALETLAPEDRQRLLDLDRYEHLVFVSANAAVHGLRCIDDYWPQYPIGARYWAVGASTAAVLEQAGIAVDSPSEDMSSEGLLAMDGLQAVSGQRILIVKGEGGRDLLRERLSERGAEVEQLRCYRRGPEPHDADECLKEIEAVPLDLILISSGEGLEYLTRLLRPRENTKLAGLSLIVPSARVTEQAREQGWRRVATADNASDEAMLAAAQAWREATSGE